MELGDVCSIDKKTLSGKVPGSYCFYYISLSDIDRGKLLRMRKCKYSEAPSRARRIVARGDVLLATVRPNLQGFYIFKHEIKDCIVSTGFAVLSPKRNQLNSSYLYQTLFSRYMLATYHAFNVGSNYPAINSLDIHGFKILLPSLPEQKSIAALLETWDTAIEKTEALIAAKAKRFKWLLKTLIGDQQDAQKGNEVRLGDLFDIQTFPAKKSFISSNGSHIYVDMGAISRHGDLIENKRTDIDFDLLSTHDLVMPKDDIGGGNIIGKVAMIEREGKYVCGDHVYRLVNKTNNNPYFLRFLINCFAVNKQLRAKANGTSQLGLGKRDVSKQKVFLPELECQSEIATLLNVAEQNINLLQRVVEKFRIQKHGLMQKLLIGQWRATT